MILNSSKLSTPSPFKSNLPIINLQSSMDFEESPNFFNILFKLFGVMTPHPSLSYISNASFKSFNFSSSHPDSISFIKSSKLNKPSPSESNDSIAISASFNSNSPPIFTIRLLNSLGEIFPSPSSSK
ncbi:hypothetical protein KIW84_042026 [Lathyrus oleraceus]|uniref:Uncharacterized protein n=1 Tax=Pisum sativum TaxID=3888 RepID=A0A9D5AM74_PEA|nr:hypothetical protein KIW84_042026 [Pisum sativum]